MPSKNMESKIEYYKHEYEGSLRERQDIKDVYVKCKGDIKKIFKHIISATCFKSKKRISDIINQMLENGEVVNFSQMQTPKTSRPNNVPISSRVIEQTNATINTASSTPTDFSRDSFSCGSHVGIQDVLQKYPGILSDFESTTPNKRKYIIQETSPKKLKLDNSVTSEDIDIKKLRYDKNGFKVLKRILPMKSEKNKNVKTDDSTTATATSQHKMKDVHNRKQDIRRQKPGPSQKLLNVNKMDISSTDTGVRLITDGLNTANLNGPNTEMCGIKDVINLETLFEAETVMDVYCSGIKPSLNSDRSRSSLTDFYKTPAPKFHDQIKNVRVLNDIQLTPPNTNRGNVSSVKNHTNSQKQENDGNKKLKSSGTRNSPLTNQKLKSSTLSNINETEYPIDLSLPLKSVEETSMASNSNESNKAVPDNNPTSSITASVVVQKDIIKRQLLQDQKEQRNSDKLRTSQSQNKNYAGSKTSNKDKSVTKLPLDGVKSNNTATNIDKTCGKINSRIVSKSVYSKQELLLGKSLKTKTEKIKNIENCLLLIRDLFSKYIKILPDNEKTVFKKFNDANNECQCICLELLTSQEMWHNIFNFSQQIRPDMDYSDIREMVVAFKENRIIDTDYDQEHEVILLNQLSKDCLIKICDDLEKEGLNIYNRYKPEEKLNKCKMIENIQKCCNTQSKINLLRTKMQKRMGICMRINKVFQQVFYSIYLFGTYTNPRFLKMQDYFKSMLADKVIFPKCSIDEYAIFTSWNDFISYSKAKMCAIDFKNLKHDAGELRQICENAFIELKRIGRRGKSQDFKDAPHLIQFTASAVYVNILTEASDILSIKYPEKVREWLEFMIRFMKEDFPHKIGCWYYNLTFLHMNYLRPPDYSRISKLITNVLDEEKQYLSDVQLERIFKIGRKLVRKKSGIFPMDRDCIVERLPRTIPKFREIIADPKSGMSNRDYYTYLLHSAWNGDKIVATFTLFFFDIIYTPNKFIPGTFVSSIQSEPLDMNTPYFYLNRKVEIEQRVSEIEKDWPNSKIVDFLKKNYDMHSHEYTICKIDDIVKDPETLENLIKGFGRNLLAKIYRRLAENFEEHRIGFPNLMISYTEKKQYFRAIKRFKDELSVEEQMWLHFLRSHEAEVEIIRTPPCEYKKNIKKVQIQDLLKPSTSSLQRKMS